MMKTIARFFQASTLLALLALAPQSAQAMPMNTPVTFSDFEWISKTISTDPDYAYPSFATYQHTLNLDLDPGDTIDIISNAITMIEMAIKPAATAPTNAMTVNAYIDGHFLASEELVFSDYVNSYSHTWAINLTSAETLDAMEDKVGNIWFGITDGKGRVTLKYSSMQGSGIVNPLPANEAAPIPEPATLLILISGCTGAAVMYSKNKAHKS